MSIAAGTTAENSRDAEFVSTVEGVDVRSVGRVGVVDVGSRVVVRSAGLIEGGSIVAAVADSYGVRPIGLVKGGSIAVVTAER